MSYGYDVEREKPDPLLTVIDTAANEFYIATSPGSWLVDTFPICTSFLPLLRDNYIQTAFSQVRHVPAWMPGAGFKKVAEDYLRTNLDQTYRPLEFVKRRLVSSNDLQ